MNVCQLLVDLLLLNLVQHRLKLLNLIISYYCVYCSIICNSCNGIDFHCYLAVIVRWDSHVQKCLTYTQNLISSQLSLPNVAETKLMKREN